ncbi:MAG: prepilin-type N-terminal cleavage/methylation domain-containing protein [bacterium]
MKRLSGFTLIELVIGMTAGAAVALMAFVLFAPAQNWLFTQSRRAGIAEGQAAVARMMREIGRVASPSQILVFDAADLQFTDVDDNTVTIQLVGSDLLLNNDPLARNVLEFALTYLDKDGNPTATKSQIRVVRARLVIQSGSQVLWLQSSERIRNAP